MRNYRRLRHYNLPIFLDASVSYTKDTTRQHPADHYRQQYQAANTCIMTLVPNWTDLYKKLMQKVL